MEAQTVGSLPPAPYIIYGQMKQDTHGLLLTYRKYPESSISSVIGVAPGSWMGL